MNCMAQDRTLTCSLETVQELTGTAVARMFKLMTDHYDSITGDQFRHDLLWKQFVLVLRDDEQTIQGFSTIAINPRGCGTDAYNVLFSGDTIIAREFWGTQEIVRGFCTAAGGFKAAEPHKRLYWYLLSKGHRTYMYLPLFFRHYIPALNTDNELQALHRVADDCSGKLFPPFWNSDTGVLQFPRRIGELKAHLADDTRARAHKRHVRFFLDRNPGYAAGDELVCVTELDAANMRSLPKKYFMRGLEQSMHWDHPEKNRVRYLETQYHY